MDLLRDLHLLLRLGAELLQVLDRAAPPQRVEAVLLARRRVRARVLGVGGAVVLGGALIVVLMVARERRRRDREVAAESGKNTATGKDEPADES